MSEENKQQDTVLSTKIDGLANLSNERFKNVEKSLERIEASNHDYATKAEVEEIRNALIKHYTDDEKNFAKLVGQNDSLKRIIYFGMGGLAVITFFLPIALHYIFKW